jgi:hypothetical protein
LNISSISPNGVNDHIKVLTHHGYIEKAGGRYKSCGYRLTDKAVDELKREIRIHKGLEQEGDGGFDPKEYEAGSPSVSTSYSAPPPAARVESRPAPAPVTKPKAVSAPDISAEDAALLEDEFLQNLN